MRVVGMGAGGEVGDGDGKVGRYCVRVGVCVMGTGTDEGEVEAGRVRLGE